MARPARLPSGIELRGDGQFRLRLRRTGLDVSETHPDLPSANAARARYLEKLAAGRGNEIAKHKTRQRQLSDTTVGDLLRQYQTDITPGKKGSHSESGRIDVLLTLPLADATLAAVVDPHASPSVLDQFIAGRLAGTWRAPVKTDTVNRELNIISHVFAVAAKKWKYTLDKNPVSLVERPKNSKPRTRRIAGEGEEKRIFEALEQCRETYLPIIVRLAVETGMRRGELLAAEWCEIDKNRRTWRVPDSKSDKPRTVALTPVALEVLDEWSEQSSGTGQVFDGVTPSAVSQAWRRARKRAGADDLRMHDLRREAVSRLFERHGLSLREVQAQAGHAAGSSQTDTYTNLDAQLLARKLDGIASAGAGLVLDLPTDLRVRLTEEAMLREVTPEHLAITLLNEVLRDRSTNQ
jgi:site-specific recombinase XerD